MYVPLLTANRQRRMHHHEWSQFSAEARRTSYFVAREANVPKMQRARVAFFPHQAKGRLADPAAHAPTCKAILDGLVDAGALPDDTGEHVERVCFYAPVRSKEDFVRVVIVPLEV